MRAYIREGNRVGYSAGREYHSGTPEELSYSNVGRNGFGNGMGKDGGNSEKESQQGLHS